MNPIETLLSLVNDVEQALGLLKDHAQTLPPAQDVNKPAPVVTILPPHVNKLNAFCLAEQTYEGYVPGKPAYINHNPGNIRCEKIMNLKAVGCSPEGFCIFPDYETGFGEMVDGLTNACKGLAVEYGYTPEMTILQFFERRDPPEDNNNPKAYAEFVAVRCGLLITDPISKLLE